MATLVTGVGYIGAALLVRLAARGERVVGLDNFFSTSAEEVQRVAAGITLIEGDVAEWRTVQRAFDALIEDEVPATVFHLAAQPSAALAREDPETTERANLTGARIVLEAARERRARVVFGGSFRVYGDELSAHTVDEQTPYGRVGDLSHLSKVYVEQLARMLGGPFASVRLGITYGLSPIMKITPTLMTVPNLFCKRAMDGEPLKVLEDQPMAFVHVEDAAEALLSAADHLARPGPDWRAYNAASEVATVGHVARTVQRLAGARGRAVEIEGATASEGGFEVRSTLAWSARRTLADGLPAVLEHFERARA